MSEMSINTNPPVYLGGSPNFDETGGAAPTIQLTAAQLQALIGEAVAKAVVSASEKLQAEAGMPKFVLNDIKELIQMFLQTIAALSAKSGTTSAAPATIATPPKVSSNDSSEQTVIVPTTPRVNEQGQVVNVISESTAAQYGVKPGVVNIGETLSSTTSTATAGAHSATASEPVVGKAIATEYADASGRRIADGIFNDAMAAQNLVEGGAAGSEGASKKVAGKATAKSWLMAIAEALGSSLGLKAQQMLNSTNEIANLSQAGEALTTQLQKLQAPGTSTEPNQAAVQTIQSQQSDNAHRFTLETSRLQGASQEFSMLQNAMSNTIKSLGESLGQLARKG